jgi:hypothetical protein
MKLLDLFAGMGGWSVGFHREGFECLGIDIVDVGYPYELIVSDIRDYHPVPVSVEVIVASPPCTEYSQLTMLSYQKGQRAKPDPEKGNELVREAKRVIDEAKPKFWILENVYGSIPHITSILGKPMFIAKPWVLWGNLPPFMFEFEPKRGGHGKGGNILGKGGGRIGLPEDFPFDPLRSWKRARIPVWLAQTIAKECKKILTSS